jgi:tRNA(fMet)-specific endonuclease VapC
VNGKFLLDTNIVIALFADEPAVKDNLAKAEEVFVPSVVVGELFYGTHKSARAKGNLARIDDFASELTARVILEQKALAEGYFAQVFPQYLANQ